MLFTLAVLAIVVILYLIEVCLGDSLSVYNCELGKASELRQTTRLSPKEFFSQMLPLLLLALGLPLLLIHYALG